MGPLENQVIETLRSKNRGFIKIEVNESAAISGR
jgi:hypothetical protein